VKRTFDIVVSFFLITSCFPSRLVTAILIALESGAPIIYRQERVGAARPNLQRGSSSEVMRPDAESDGKGNVGRGRRSRVMRWAALFARAA